MRNLTFIAALALGILAAPAAATITITTNQQDAQGANILFPGSDVDGASVIGATQSGYQLTFSTLTGQTLTTPAQGQARVEAVGTTLNSLNIAATDGGTFDFIEFNLFSGASPVTITGFDQNGTAFSLIFGDDAGENLNGENFFLAMTDAAQSIRSLSFSGGAFTDIRQIRVGQNVVSATAAVPEPATWAMMLLGLGAVGVSLRRRRTTRRHLAQCA